MSLLSCFSTELALAREFRTIEPNSIAKVLAESFVVQIRTTLATTSEHAVVIPTVGQLIVRDLTVNFEPDSSLNSDYSEKRFRLHPYIAELFPKSPIAELPIFKQGSAFPYSGLRLLETIGAFFLREEWEQDRSLRKLSIKNLEFAMCLTIHDAISSGSGIEIESVGLFKLSSFTPDAVLLRTIRHQFGNPNRNLATF